MSPGRADLPDRFAQPLERSQAPVHLLGFLGVTAAHPELKGIKSGRLAHGELGSLVVGSTAQGADEARLSVDSPRQAEPAGDGRIRDAGVPQLQDFVIDIFAVGGAG